MSNRVAKRDKKFKHGEEVYVFQLGCFKPSSITKGEIDDRDTHRLGSTIYYRVKGVVGMLGLGSFPEYNIYPDTVEGRENVKKHYLKVEKELIVESREILANREESLKQFEKDWATIS
jgi:hypothetical protein